jgi:hypothetical protein
LGKNFSQLPKENWFDLLAFLPRPLLGEIVTEIGNRQFAKIVQSFLHEHGQIIFNCGMEIVGPYDEDPSGCARVRVWHKRRKENFRFPFAQAQMPTNIRNFYRIRLRFLLSLKPCANFSIIWRFGPGFFLLIIDTIKDNEYHWDMVAMEWELYSINQRSI